MKTVAFFNNKGGVGKTTLTYHLAWMFHHLGVRVLLADLDPQANLTAAFLDDEAIERLWAASPAQTILGAVEPLVERLGDLRKPAVQEVDGIGLIAGARALSLSRFSRIGSRKLGQRASMTMPRTPRTPFGVITSFYRVVKAAADERHADVALLDVGPNLGALNRAALVAADAVVVPLSADLFSLRGLRNLGPVLRDWCDGWRTRSERPHASSVALPSGAMQPIGYVVLQHAAKKANEPARAYQRWIDRLPAAFHQELISDQAPQGQDPYRLALLRHFRSLLPLSLEARKPVFDLKAADGATAPTPRRSNRRSKHSNHWPGPLPAESGWRCLRIRTALSLDFARLFLAADWEASGRKRGEASDRNGDERVMRMVGPLSPTEENEL